MGVLATEKAPGLGGLAGLGRSYQSHAGPVDVQGGAVHGEDRMGILEDVAGHSQRDALHPSVVVEVEQEHGMGGHLVLCMEVGVRIVQTEDPGMGAHAVGHVIEVVRPHLDVIAVLGDERDADAVDVGLRRERVEPGAPVPQLPRPVLPYGDESVRHVRSGPIP